MNSPMHPGLMLQMYLEGIVEETGKKLTVAEVAQNLNVSRGHMTAILKGRAGISPDMAIKLSIAFQDTPEFWMRLQENFDLAEARKRANTKNVKVFWQRNEANREITATI